MIVVVGSINADLFFTVDQLPQQGETVLCPDYQIYIGGKGANQAVAAANAGAATRMVGAVGDDVFAATARQCLLAAGVDVAAVSDRSGATGTAMVAVDGHGENQIIVASGANTQVAANQLPADWLGRETTMVLQMEIPAATNQAVIAAARAAGCRIILNLAPAAAMASATLQQTDILIANRGEAAVLLPGDVGPLEQAARIARMYQVTAIITLGSAGLVAVSADGQSWQIPALDIAAIDSVGAGDAFVGGFAAALDGGADLGEALVRGSVAGGLACTDKGPQSSPKKTRIDRHVSALKAFQMPNEHVTLGDKS